MKKTIANKVFTSLAALATLTTGGTPPAPAPATHTSIHQPSSTTSQQQAPVQQQVNTVKQYHYAPGGQFLFNNNGIPPVIYGTYYVKRGTHKRTNK